MLMDVICFTISEGLCRSMRRLWIRNWKRSQVYGTFTTRRLPGGDAQDLGWHTNGSLYLQALFLGTTDEISTHLFKAFHIPTGQGDPDAMDGWSILSRRLASFFVMRHFKLNSGRRNRV